MHNPFAGKAHKGEASVRPRRRVLRCIGLFALGVAVLVGLQAGLLFYLNDVYLKKSEDYTVTRINSSAVSAQKHRSVSLPSDAVDVGVSNDGDYIAWLENGQITVTDLLTGKVSTVSPQKNRTIDYFKWIYDGHRLTILEKNTEEDEDKGYYDEIYGYDVDTSTTQLLTNYQNNNKETIISLRSRKESVTDLDFSNETTVYFFRLTTATSSSDGDDASSLSSSSSSAASSSGTSAYAGRSRIWKVNNTQYNDALPDLPVHTIGRINSVKSDDALLFEDSSTGRVYYYNGRKDNILQYTVDGHRDLRLLGFDQADNEYIGAVENGKVAVLYYGDAVKKQWQTMTLPVPTDASNIYVSYSGSVFVSDSAAQTMTDLVGGQSVSYTGSILAVYDSGFYTVENGTVQDHPVSNAGTTDSSVDIVSSEAVSTASDAGASSASDGALSR